MVLFRFVCTSLLLQSAAPESLPSCFPQDPHHHLGGDGRRDEPSANDRGLVSAASLSIHHPIHVLTASLKDVASILVISSAADTQHEEISARADAAVCNILPSAVEGPRSEIERCDKDKIKLCSVLIVRSLVKGGQSSCREGIEVAELGSARMGSGTFSS